MAGGGVTTGLSVVDVDVAIIGAGAAGIAAAHTCRLEGLSHRLIEARLRTGGRCVTDRYSLGVPFDRGASWIHAADRDHPLANAALASGLHVLRDPRRRIPFSNGGACGPNETERFLAARKRAVDRMLEVAAALGPDVSAEQAITANLLDCPWERTARAYIGPWTAGTDLGEVGVADWNETIAGEDWVISDGYGTLLRQLAADLPAQEHTQLGCRLEALRVQRDHVDIVTTCGSLRAFCVVLTVPLSVLASGDIRIEPPLSNAELRALDDLPLGCLLKIGLRLDGDPMGLGDSYYIVPRLEKQPDFFYFARPGGVPLLYAMTGGHHARALEGLGDAQCVEAALAPLREIFGQGIRRSFKATAVARWGRDRFAQGTYSIARAGGLPARAALRRPLHDRIYIAGEATAPRGWQATVAGAWLAGRQAVETIARRH